MRSDIKVFYMHMLQRLRMFADLMRMSYLQANMVLVVGASYFTSVVGCLVVPIFVLKSHIYVYVYNEGPCTNVFAKPTPLFQL